MNNVITEIKSNLEGVNRRITEAEERISEVEDGMVEINEAERKKRKKCLKQKKYHASPRNPESPKQDKPKAKHPKTNYNQTNKDQTHRENIKSTKGKATNNTQGDPHKHNS